MRLQSPRSKLTGNLTRTINTIPLEAPGVTKKLHELDSCCSLHTITEGERPPNQRKRNIKTDKSEVPHTRVACSRLNSNEEPLNCKTTSMPGKIEVIVKNGL